MSELQEFSAIPLNRAEAAQFLTARGFRIAPATLAKLASIGGGPKFKSFGRKPLYQITDLIQWAELRCTGSRASTSDPGEPIATTGAAA